MAYIFNRHDVTLKIDNLRKKEHFFYEDGNDAPIGKLEISRNKLLARIISYRRDDEELYEKIASCYDQFVNNNSQRFKNYDVKAGQIYSNEMKNYTESFPFDIHQIKKELNTPINLVTKDQIDELNEFGVPYYSIYNNDTYGGFNSGNKNILFSLEERLLIPRTSDFFKDNVLNVYFESSIGGVKVNTRRSVPIFRISKMLNDKSFDENSEIWMPKVNVLKKEESGELYETKEIEKPLCVQIISEDFRNPLNLSNIDIPNIHLKMRTSKENFLKTLETIGDKDNTKFLMERQSIERLGLPHKNKGLYIREEYKCNELIDFLKNHINDLSLDK